MCFYQEERINRKNDIEKIKYCQTFIFWLSTINLLETNGVIDEFSKLFETVYTAPKDVITSFSDASLHFANVISENFGKIWLSVLSTTLVILFAYHLLKNISFYNISSLMHLKMTSFVDLGFTRNLISTLGQSVRFALAKILYKLPFVAIKTLIIFIYLNLAVTPLGIFIGLFITSLFLIIFTAIEMVTFSGMAGYMLENDGATSALKAFFAGCVPVFKKFPRLLSNSIIAVITLVALNVFLGIFTLGVALLITVPATIMFVAIFELCTYFNAKEKRYYLTSTTIATPITEKEGDNIKKF